MQPHTKPGEWRRVLLFTLFIVIFTTIPYVIGWQSAGHERVYNGFLFGIDDGNAYLGKMRIGVEGGWNFYLFFTPEDHDDAFGLYLPYILIGHLVRLLVNPAPDEIAGMLTVAFQIFRIVATFLTILAFYRFIAEFLRSTSARWMALILATLGGGLGWLLIILGQREMFGTLPPEFYIPEGFSFLVLLGLPHIALGRAALLLGFVALFAALRQKQWRYVILGGLLWNIVGLMVTFYLAVLYAVMAAWGVALWLRWGKFPLEFAKMAGVAIGLTLPQFFYSAWLFSSNEAFAQWSRQNYLPSPHPLHYLLAYLVLVIFAVPGAMWAWRRAAKPAHEGYALLVGWILVVPVLVYLPLNVQRRLSESVLIPLAILTTAGLRLAVQCVWKSISLHRRYVRLRLLLYLLVLPSTLLFWAGMLIPQPPAFQPKAGVAAMDWLADNTTEPDAVVMGSFRTENYLPVRTGLRPFYGHGPETLYSEEKAELVEKFYQNQLSTKEIDSLLRDYEIRYVIWGVFEQELADGAAPVWSEELPVIYDQDGYVIYEVERD